MRMGFDMKGHVLISEDYHSFTAFNELRMLSYDKHRSYAYLKCFISKYVASLAFVEIFYCSMYRHAFKRYLFKHPSSPSPSPYAHPAPTHSSPATAPTPRP